MAECIFRKCAAECCRYVTVYLSAPKSKIDFDEIKWFVSHENVTVYRDTEKQWLVEFRTPCKFLNGDNTCRCYANRPNVCAQYDPDNCTAHNTSPYFDIMLRTPEDVDRFSAKRWGKKGGNARGKKRK